MEPRSVYIRVDNARPIPQGHRSVTQPSKAPSHKRRLRRKPKKIGELIDASARSRN